MPKCRGHVRYFVQILSFLGAILVVSGEGVAQGLKVPPPSEDPGYGERPALSFFGAPGIIELPVAGSMPDGDVSLSASWIGNSQYNTLTFQITPRLSGSFRYAGVDDYIDRETTLYDRSFDLRYRFIDETTWRPAMTVGLQDFGGTGVLGGEYVVATKTVSQRLRVTGGLGWGRFATNNAFTNPLGIFSSSLEARDARATGGLGATGTLDFGNWFRGDAALFGGVEWQVSDQLQLSLEYSSAAFVAEPELGDFDSKTPLNIAATYRTRNGFDITGAFLHGTTLGVMLNYTINPKLPQIVGGMEASAPAVMPRASATALGWDLSENSSTVRTALRQRVAAGLQEQGVRLDSLSLKPGHVVLHITNQRYLSAPEAIGRTARVLTGILPATVETFTIVPMASGMNTTAVTVRRSDLEELEHDLDGSWKMYARTELADGVAQRPEPGARMEDVYPDFTYNLGSYLAPSYFDPDAPVRADFGLQLRMAYTPRPGLVLSTAMRQPLAGNLADSTRISNSVLPHVRSDAPLYDSESDFEISYLTLEHFRRPAPDFYGRLTFGYLEKMYGGLSGEVLWKPTQSSLALGLELNYVVQRDFDMLFGFQDYDIVTGHASAYYDFGNGFIGQVDAGRYLAGDWGTTISLDREFDNGFRIGAFATFTDVSFDDFGEGSFDKGIRFSIPVSWLSGDATMDGFGQTIRPLTRDGGARLDVRNRLYNVVRGYHQPELEEDWGRFWR